jgi:hypothetical protein
MKPPIFLKVSSFLIILLPILEHTILLQLLLGKAETQRTSRECYPVLYESNEGWMHSYGAYGALHIVERILRLLSGLIIVLSLATLTLPHDRPLVIE